MERSRKYCWTTAGLVLAASATSPALAQSVPGGTMVTPVPGPYPVQQTGAVTPPEVLVPVETARPACEPCVKPPTLWQRLFGFKREKPPRYSHDWGRHCEFEAKPLGAAIDGHFRTMIANGDAARMILHRYDFVEGSESLNVRGRDQLAKIANLATRNGFSIIVERLPDNPTLAEARRASVAAVLAHNGLPISPERVVIGVPIAIGLRGVEAARQQSTDTEGLHESQLNNTRTQSRPIPPPSNTSTTGGGTGGTGGSGGSGGTGTGRQ